MLLEHTNLHIIENCDYVNTDLTDAVHLNLQGAENLASGIIDEISSNDPNHLEKEMEFTVFNAQGLQVKNGIGLLIYLIYQMVYIPLKQKMEH